MRLYHLDVIRGLAALSVFFVHWDGSIKAIPLYKHQDIVNYFFDIIFQVFKSILWANQGLHPGVVAFVVLSGFCIHLAQSSRKADTGKYFLRRFIRIYPVFLFSLALGYFNSFINMSNLFDWEAFVTNFFVSMTLLYAFFPVPAPYGNEILGTVIVLIILYTTYPVILRLSQQFGWRIVFSCAAILYILNLIFFAFHFDPVWIGRNYYALLFYWVIGAYAGSLFSTTRKRGKSTMKIWPLILFFITYVLIGNFINFKGAHFPKTIIFSVWFSWLLYAVCINDNSQSGVVIKVICIPFVKIGQISYSLYCVQLPVIGMVLSSSFLFSVFSPRIITLIITLLATLLCYFAIERPSLKFAVRYA